MVQLADNTFHLNTKESFNERLEIFKKDKGCYIKKNSVIYHKMKEAFYVGLTYVLNNYECKNYEFFKRDTAARKIEKSFQEFVKHMYKDLSKVSKHTLANVRYFFTHGNKCMFEFISTYINNPQIPSEVMLDAFKKARDQISIYFNTRVGDNESNT